MAFERNDIAADANLGMTGDVASSLSEGSRPPFDWKAASRRALVIAKEVFTEGWIARTIRKSLRRRILLANLLGLASLLLAILYLSLHHGWLLDAKVDVVRTISRITAEAIAYRAVNEHAIFDPDRLPKKAAPRVRRDDAFAALELPIDPHLAAVVIRKVVGPADLEARIYSTRGSLILNSDTLFSNDSEEEDEAAADNEAAPRLKNFWTRLNYWVINKELKVYRELGTANGFLYPAVRRAAKGGRETPILLLNRRGQQIVSMAEPIKRGNKILGVLLLSTKPGDIDDVLWDERWLILQISAIALVVSIGSSLILERTVAGPMRRLSEAAIHVTQNISARQELPDLVGRHDEVGQTGRAFVAMTNALSRRIEASEKFAADVAHELKNPLAAARSTAEALSYAKSDGDRDELVKEIQVELTRLNRLINDISSTSRLDAELARQQMQVIDVRTILNNVKELFADMLTQDSRKIALIAEPGPASSYTVRGNDVRLGQVFTNLIDNALSFSPEGGTVTVRAKPVKGKIEISIEDEGPGIPPDRLDQIFDRFYSDRPETDRKRGKNSGLGLSISREIISSHNGEVFAENCTSGKAERPAGARFTVRLPLSVGGAGFARRG